jgi:hypothetical protein
MSYIEQFETELRKKFAEAKDDEVLFRWISEKILESYRNGITAAQKGAKVIRKAWRPQRRKSTNGKAYARRKINARAQFGSRGQKVPMLVTP